MPGASAPGTDTAHGKARPAYTEIVNQRGRDARTGTLAVVGAPLSSIHSLLPHLPNHTYTIRHHLGAYETRRFSLLYLTGGTLLDTIFTPHIALLTVPRTDHHQSLI